MRFTPSTLVPGCSVAPSDMRWPSFPMPRLARFKETFGGKLYAPAIFPYNSEVTGPAQFQAMLNRLAPFAGR